MSAPRLTEPQKRAILADYRAGMPPKQIGIKHGVNNSYPRLLARRRGVTLITHQKGKRPWKS